MKFKLINAYTLREVFSHFSNYEFEEGLLYDWSEEFLKVVEHAFNIEDPREYEHFSFMIKYDALNSQYVIKEEFAEILNILYDRFNYSYCLFIPEEINDVEARKVILNIMNIFHMTYNYYTTLLKAYKSEENNLLGKISTSTNSLSRFNDTPQDEGDFANDEHTTNINQVESEVLTDLNSPIMRLKEIQDSYKNLLEDWSNEFKKLFREELAL